MAASSATAGVVLRRRQRRSGSIWRAPCRRQAAPRCYWPGSRRRLMIMTDDALAVARPLQGRRIAVTRAHEQAGDLIARLRALGADPLECPAIAIAPPATYAPLDAALARLGEYDWIIFTSVNGVAAFRERLAL